MDLLATPMNSVLALFGAIVSTAHVEPHLVFQHITLQSTWLQDNNAWIKYQQEQPLSLVTGLTWLLQQEDNNAVVDPETLCTLLLDALLLLLPSSQVVVIAQQDHTGRSLLHWACLLGYSRLAEYLVQVFTNNSISTSLLDSFGGTALSYASRNGNKHLVALLEFSYNTASSRIPSPTGPLNSSMHLLSSSNSSSTIYATDNENDSTEASASPRNELSASIISGVPLPPPRTVSLSLATSQTLPEDPETLHARSTQLQTQTLDRPLSSTQDTLTLSETALNLSALIARLPPPAPPRSTSLVSGAGVSGDSATNGDKLKVLPQNLAQHVPLRQLHSISGTDRDSSSSVGTSASSVGGTNIDIFGASPGSDSPSITSEDARDGSLTKRDKKKDILFSFIASRKDKIDEKDDKEKKDEQLKDKKERKKPGKQIKDPQKDHPKKEKSDRDRKDKPDWKIQDRKPKTVDDKDQEKKDKEQKAQEKRERDKKEKERREQEKKEKEKREREKKENEKKERERKEKMRKEKEKQERERKEKEKKEKKERQKQEKERKEREKQEKERLDKERKEREKKEKKERERKEKQEKKDKQKKERKGFLGLLSGTSLFSKKKRKLKRELLRRQMQEEMSELQSLLPLPSIHDAPQVHPVLRLHSLAQLLPIYARSAGSRLAPLPKLLQEALLRQSREGGFHVTWQTLQAQKSQVKNWLRLNRALVSVLVHRLNAIQRVNANQQSRQISLQGQAQLAPIPRPVLLPPLHTIKLLADMYKKWLTLQSPSVDPLNLNVSQTEEKQQEQHNTKLETRDLLHAESSFQVQQPRINLEQSHTAQTFQSNGHSHNFTRSSLSLKSVARALQTRLNLPDKQVNRRQAQPEHNQPTPYHSAPSGSHWMQSLFFPVEETTPSNDPLNTSMWSSNETPVTISTYSLSTTTTTTYSPTIFPTDDTPNEDPRSDNSFTPVITSKTVNTKPTQPITKAHNIVTQFLAAVEHQSQESPHRSSEEALSNYEIEYKNISEVPDTQFIDNRALFLHPLYPLPDANFSHDIEPNTQGLQVSVKIRELPDTCTKFYDSRKEFSQSQTGSFWLARSRDTGRAVAIKQVGLTSIGCVSSEVHRTQVVLESYKRAYKFATSLGEEGDRSERQYYYPDNTLFYYGAYISDGRLCTVTEYMEEGTLAQFLSRYKAVRTLPHVPPVTWVHINYIAGELLKGIHHLHTYLGLVHCKLSPENIFFDLQGHVKIGNLTQCLPIRHSFRDGKQLNQITSLDLLPYIAPELISGDAGTYIDPRVDVWSLGMMLVEIVDTIYPNIGAQLFSPTEPTYFNLETPFLSFSELKGCVALKLLHILSRPNFVSRRHCKMSSTGQWPSPSVTDAGESLSVLRMADMCLCYDFKSRPNARYLLEKWTENPPSMGSALQFAFSVTLYHLMDIQHHQYLPAKKILTNITEKVQTIQISNLVLELNKSNPTNANKLPKQRAPGYRVQRRDRGTEPRNVRGRVRAHLDPNARGKRLENVTTMPVRGNDSSTRRISVGVRQPRRRISGVERTSQEILEFPKEKEHVIVNPEPVEKSHPNIIPPATAKIPKKNSNTANIPNSTDITNVKPKRKEQAKLESNPTNLPIAPNTKVKAKQPKGTTSATTSPRPKEKSPASKPKRTQSEITHTESAIPPSPKIAKLRPKVPQSAVTEIADYQLPPMPTLEEDKHSQPVSEDESNTEEETDLDNNIMTSEPLPGNKGGLKKRWKVVESFFKNITIGKIFSPRNTVATTPRTRKWSQPPRPRYGEEGSTQQTKHERRLSHPTRVVPTQKSKEHRTRQSQDMVPATDKQSRHQRQPSKPKVKGNGNSTNDIGRQIKTSQDSQKPAKQPHQGQELDLTHNPEKNRMTAVSNAISEVPEQQKKKSQPHLRTKHTKTMSSPDSFEGESVRRRSKRDSDTVPSPPPAARKKIEVPKTAQSSTERKTHSRSRSLLGDRHREPDLEGALWKDKRDKHTKAGASNSTKGMYKDSANSSAANASQEKEHIKKQEEEEGEQAEEEDTIVLSTTKGDEEVTLKERRGSMPILSTTSTSLPQASPSILASSLPLPLPQHNKVMSPEETANSTTTISTTPTSTVTTAIGLTKSTLPVDHMNDHGIKLPPTTPSTLTATTTELTGSGNSQSPNVPLLSKTASLSTQLYTQPAGRASWGSIFMKKTVADGKEIKEVTTSVVPLPDPGGTKETNAKPIKKPKEKEDKDPKSARLSNLSILFKLSSDDLSELAKEFQAPEETSANRVSASMEEAHEADEESAKEKEVVEPPMADLTAHTGAKSQKKNGNKSKHTAQQSDPRQGDSKPSLLSAKPKKPKAAPETTGSVKGKQLQGKNAPSLKVTFKFPTPATVGENHDKQETGADETPPALDTHGQGTKKTTSNTTKSSHHSPKKAHSSTKNTHHRSKEVDDPHTPASTDPDTTHLIHQRVNTHE